MNFIAIDVETANADMASICQIGIAEYSGNQLIGEWVSLVNPEDYFDPVNIGVHGINESDITNAPKFPELSEKLSGFLSDTIVVSHTHFDRVSIDRVFRKYDLKLAEAVWLDSAKVARRAWPEFAKKGYGLKNVARHIGHEFNHHDALEDAKAAGKIMIEAIKVSNLGLSDWIKRTNQPINPIAFSGGHVKTDGNSEGRLFGEVAVFTGSLEMPRAEAAILAAGIGCNVAPNVTKTTTSLIVGDQDVSKLHGKEKSSKHIKAEKLINNGQLIRIITESEFKGLLNDA